MHTQFVRTTFPFNKGWLSIFKERFACKIGILILLFQGNAPQNMNNIIEVKFRNWIDYLT